MGPQLQSVNFNFSQGLELKQDPKQIPTGKFLALQNTIFNKGGLLQKRNGFGQLTLIPSGVNATYLTTFNNNLTAISNTVNAFNPANNDWITKGTIQPLSLNTLPLIRSNTNQSQADISICSTDLICTVYTDQNPANLAQPLYKYAVANSITGQNIISPTIIPANGGGTIIGAPRVFNLGNYFIILFTNHIGSSFHLQFIAISTVNVGNITAPSDITNSYSQSNRLSYDAVISGSNLYIVFSSSSGGQAVKACFLNNSLAVSSFLTFAGQIATIMGVTTDDTNIAASYYDSVSSTGHTLVFNQALQVVMAPVQIISSGVIDNIAPALQNNIVRSYYEVDNNYSYDSTIPTHFINSIDVPISTSIPSAVTMRIRSLGLASKTFIINNIQYFLAAYQSNFQPTYFLINGSSSTQAMPIVVAKLAYQNGGGYLSTGLPNAIVNGNAVSIPYLFKDLVTAVNKDTNVPAGTQVNGIYSQLGINYTTITLGTQEFDSVEIGSALQMSGGFLWMYDGYLPVEHNFLLYPDNVEVIPQNSGGGMSPQKYFYQVVYEWADNQGNIHQSAPSVPVEVDMSSANLAFTPPTPITFTGAGAMNQNIMDVSSQTGLQVGQIITDVTNPGFLQANTAITGFPSGITISLSLPIATTIGSDTIETVDICSTTVNIPTLRLTYKIANPVKAVIYRWSTAQQEYYQVTTIEAPLLNDTTVDAFTFTDTLPDSEILGNRLIYTTGGVVEDIGAPANNIMTLWQTRLFLVDAEDQNLIWFSKQVIENTPVEMSDLFTIFVAPTIGASGSTGPITALGQMDDKLIIFKKDAIYYVSGTGPDNTGANNLFSDPIFITSVAGCTNQQSLINTPQGIMFQSDKGIWMLDRSLGTNYIGAPIETLALSANVLSAVLVPGTNQVRFTLDSNITLVYDYYYAQWSTFNNLFGISSCIQNSLHTFLDSFGRIFQETPGLYLDGTEPVLISFTTGWLNLAGISGYQRIYELGLVGTYFTPHLLEVQIAYNFGNPIQQSTINPLNPTGVWGSDSQWGQTTPWGGPGNLEQWRIHAQKQKCQVFQVTVNEVFNPMFGNMAGQGLNISGIRCDIGVKSGRRPYSGNQSVG